MKHIEGIFEGFEKLNLYYQSWYPEEQVQAIVVLVHGLGGHSTLFNPVAEYLVTLNYEVHALDLRGHGRSPGKRGHVNSWAEFREDLRLFIQTIRAQRTGCSYFLWGHSLGGTIALDYALRFADGLQGVIATAPALGRVKISPIKLGLGRLLSGVWPSFSLKLGIHNDLCSRNPDICAAYLADPLRHEFGSARLATEFFATVDWIYNNSANLQIPLLLLHGSADQVTLPEASLAFFQQVMFSDKEHHEYPGCYHDLFVDIDYRTVFSDLQNWLERHLGEADSCEPFTFCPS